MHTTSRKLAISARPLLRVSLVAILLAGSAGISLRAQGSSSEQVDGARVALEKYMEARRVLAVERRNWTLGKEVLESQIGLLRREVEALRERLDAAGQSMEEAERKRLELVAERDRMRKASEAMQQVLVPFESRVLALISRLPDPLRETIKPMSQRIPAAGEETRLSTAERFQSLVWVLNQVNKWNREIALNPEIRELGEGVTAEVGVLYIGLAQAYYATAKGDAAGVGVPGADGWLWSPRNGEGPRIARAMAILKNEQPAAFVPLPVTVQ